jgi:hypothetical protein
MSRRLQTQRLCLAALLLMTLRAGAQYYRYGAVSDETRWITLDVDRAALGVYAEGYEMDSSTKGAPDYHQSRYFVGPLIGLGLYGSVYHPNLLTYRLNIDGSLGYSEETYSGTVVQKVDQLRYLGSFSGDVKLLDSRPFNGRLFTTYAHTYQDYDFFNRVYIDTLRYGGGVHYTVGQFSLAGTVYRETQDSTSYGTPVKTDSRVATVEASQSRDSGGTSLVGTINDYTRYDYGVLGNGQDYTLAGSDSEDFGSRKQFHSVVNGSYNHTETSLIPSDLYAASGNLRIEHTDRLTSQYLVNYSRNSSQGTETDNLSGNATLRHQLYDSLTSEMLVEGYRYSAGNGSDQLDSWQFGGGPGVHYVKQLSDSSRLSAYESVVLLHTDLESSGGLIQVVDEQHSFGSSAGGGPSGSFVLRQPNVVVSTILITDTGHQPPGGYIRGLDYDVIVNGQLVTIQRVTGSRMPDTVLVSYTFNASPSGGYDTLNNACGLRLDFFNYHWSVFTRFNLNRNYGAGDIPVQDLNDFVAGTEGNWRFIRAGFEYEIYDSSLSPFQAMRLYQNFTFHPEDNSSLSLNFNETFTRYEAANRSDENYTAILRYNRSLGRHLALNLDLGASQRVGPGVDQTLAVFRPQLQYSSGSLSATIGYDYGYDEYLNTQTRIRNMGFIRIRKEF